MGSDYQEYLWPSFFGFQEDAALLHKSGHIYHSIIDSDFNNGAVRSILLSVLQEDEKKYSIAANYLYHPSNSESQTNEFFRLDFQKTGARMALISAQVFGAMQNVEDKDVCFGLSRASSVLFEHIAHRHEWINPVSIVTDKRISVPAVGRGSLPGLYMNGDLKIAVAHKGQSSKMNQEPVFPALFFPGIGGYGPESYTGKKDISRSITVPDPQGGGVYILHQVYEQGQSARHVHMHCDLTHHTSQGESTVRLYQLEVIPAEAQNSVKIKGLKVLGTGQSAESSPLLNLDIRNPKAVIAGLKEIRMLNRLLRSGQEGLRNEMLKKPQDRRIFLPTDIQLLSQLNLVTNAVPPALKKSGRFIFSVIGGNATKKIVSDYDLHIGANGYKLDYYPHGAKTASSLILDAGVLFHDKFDIAFFNAGKYLAHKYDKSHVPESRVRAFLFTHRHKDHLAQLSYLVKKGYILPPLIMPPLAYRQLQRDMRELEVERKVQKEILDMCLVIDSLRDVDPRNPNKIRKIKIGGETIEQWTEVVPGERLGQNEYFPILKIGDFKIRIGPMPHSDPGSMYDIITPAGSHRHTGDYKLDPTIQVMQGCFRSWLRAHQPDSMSADSTGSTRGDEKTPDEAVIGESIARLMRENPKNRFLCPILGSNAARFTTLIAAAGEAGRKYIIVDGKALEDLMRDLDKTLNLKKWALDMFGVKVLSQATAEAKRVLEEESDSDVILAITGTQDEPYSSLKGPLVYRAYMMERKDEPLKEGPVFSFIKDFSQIQGHEIVLCSRNSPLTALRAMRTLQRHNITPSRFMFTNGKSLTPYLPVYNIDQFLSTNEGDVRAAQKSGIAAALFDHSRPFSSIDFESISIKTAQVTPIGKHVKKEGNILSIRSAQAAAAIPDLHYIFDFDGVLAGYSAEAFFKKNNHNLEIYQNMERALIDRPLELGPQYSFFEKLNKLNEKAGYDKNLMSIVTARGFYAGIRSINTLASWGLEPNNEMHCLAGLGKQPVLSILKEAYPQKAIFYDDGARNIEDAKKAGVPAGRIFPDLEPGAAG